MKPRGEGIPDEPPADPEEWTDEQWLAWLEATDPDGDRATGHDAALRPLTSLNRLARSSGGHVLGQAMLGIANVIYGRREDEIVVVADSDGEPDTDEPFTVHLDPDHPERSSVVFRRPRR